MKKIHYTVIIIIALLSSCSKDLAIHSPIDKDSSNPSTISNVSVKNFDGGATISYRLPNDPDLQYILATYQINSTTTREAKASAHMTELNVDGFGDTGKYPVTLYAVDRSGNRSAPTVVQVEPLEPSFQKVFKSLTLIEDFGGASLTFTNKGKGNVGIVVLTADNNGDLTPNDALYTSQESGFFSVRGFDTVSRVFGVYVRDRWNNRSDTIIKTLKPLYETLLDKNKFAEYKLPTDAPAGYTGLGYVPSRAWDRRVEDLSWHTAEGGGITMPLHVTMDLGVVARLSRFTMWDRPGFLFAHHNARKFIIWGSATAPNPNGSYDGWIKLRECEAIKPSGLPVGQNNADDIAAAARGNEFSFPSGTPAVRYIRIQVLQTWGNTTAFHLSEISFWGQPSTN